MRNKICSQRSIDREPRTRSQFETVFAIFASSIASKIECDSSDFVLPSESRKFPENRANRVEQHNHFALRSCSRIFNLFLHHLS